MDEKKATRSDRARRILLVVACAFALFAFVGRADSFEQMEMGVRSHWFVLGPLWGLWAFLALRRRLSVSYRNTILATLLALLVSLSVGALFGHREKYKMQVRLGPDFAKYYDNYRSNKNLEPAPGHVR